MSTVYRYSFETDEQYQARIEALQQPTKQTGETGTPLPQAFEALPPDPRQSTTGLVFPGWLAAVIVVVLLIGIYRSSRRRLIQQERKRREKTQGQDPVLRNFNRHFI